MFEYLIEELGKIVMENIGLTLPIIFIVGAIIVSAYLFRNQTK